MIKKPWYKRDRHVRRADGGIDVYDWRGTWIASHPPEEDLRPPIGKCERRMATWVLAAWMVAALVVATVVTVGSIMDLDPETVEVRE